MDAVQERVDALLRERLHVLAPSCEADLLTTGLVDSLGLVELCAGLEEQFQIRVGLEDLDPEHFRSIARIAAFVRGRHAASRSDGDHP